VASLLGGSMVYSLVKTKRLAPEEPPTARLP
jgi:hypothetical protein